MFRRGPRRSPPVKVEEELDVTIEAVGEKGDGIAKKDGFILFVKDTQQGERCRIRITKVLEKVGFAEKIGEAQSPAPPPPRKHIQPEPEPESSYEDSEDFGEEPEEEETPKDEPARKEVPAEHPAGENTEESSVNEAEAGEPSNPESEK